MLSRIAPVLALIGVPMSIWYLGEHGELWGLFYCWFCLTILFWWYLANVVFATSKRERRNAAFKKVTKRKGPSARTDRFQKHIFSIAHIIGDFKEKYDPKDSI